VRQHGRRRQRPLSARAVAGRRQDAGGDRRRLGRGACRRGERGQDAHPAVERRPRDRHARRAARAPGRAVQPPQRSADRRRRDGRAQRRRPQRQRSHRGPRVVAGRRLACLLVLDVDTPLGDQVARRRAPHRNAGDAARVPRLTHPRSTPPGATCISCRCARSTRCTTACSSSCRSRGRRGRT